MIVIFGCGQGGYQALKLLKSNNPTEIVKFCDNYKHDIDPDTGIEIINFEQLKLLSDRKLYIAAGRFQEIYIQCVVDDVRVDGIYDAGLNKFLSYYEYCYLNHTGYFNVKFIKYSWLKQKKLNEEKVETFKKQKILSKNITSVSIELSNLCNYAEFHPQCPASKVKEKVIISLDNYKKIIDELVELNFEGMLGFNIYNEPMIDPRLFYMLEYAGKLKKCTRLVYTNGYYLNQTMVKDLEQFAEILAVTGYGKSEYERIMNLEINIAFCIIYGALDERLNNYEKGQTVESDRICSALLSDCSIYANGDLGLCCLDYKHEYNLGNVFEEGLKQVLDRESNVTLLMKLLNGERDTYPLCCNCGWSR